MRALFSKPWVLALFLLLLVVAGFMRLRLETDILGTLPEDLPEVKALRLLRDGFSGGSDLLIAMQAEDDALAEDAMTTLAERLEKRTDLVKEVRWAQPMEQQAQSGAALMAWALQNTDPAQLKAVRERLTGDGAKAKLQQSLQTVAGSLDAEKVQRASYDPLGLLDSLDASAMSALEGSMFGLVSEDGLFRLLLVTPAQSVSNYKSAAAWLDQMKAEIAQWRQDQDPENKLILRYTGEPAFQSEIGAGIEKDMSNTVGLTEVLIAVLFWVMFRRLKPLLWIQGLLMLSMILTLGAGGLLVGKLSIMSLGFAAIVLGIIVDYAVLIIQESRQHPHLDSKGLRKLAAPGIVAGACTTSTVFLSLLFSGLPGLSELGLLVAVGVLVGLGVMLTFAPKFAAGKQPPNTVVEPSGQPAKHGLAIVATLLLFGGMAGIFAVKGLPKFQTSAETLRPSNSEAMDTLQWVQDRLGQLNEASLPVLITGPTEELRARTQKLADKLAAAVKDGTLVRQAMPTLLIGDPAAQQDNREFIQWLLAERPRLEKEIDAAGFADAAAALLRSVCSVWEPALKGPWPQDETTAAAGSVLSRLLATGERAVKGGMQPGQAVALASVSVTGKPGLPDRDKLAAVQALLTPDTGAWVAGWETLGRALSTLVQHDLNQQLLPIMGIIAFTLLVTFRSVKDLLLSILLLGGGLGALAATMSLLEQGWNLASLAAIPLLLGTGIDYGIHLLLALKRSGNDIRHVQATTGKAVFFSGMTTVIGFASLFFAGNRGISSLGLACCVGTLWILLIVLWLVPHWRAWLRAK
ncbi:Predicted exporter protein, RND superfamily [Prosthecobacter debontii]|uniref:Predicted exporter protein, RND superfamily n=1 Tax=Prosthecobacter debontii TaxID=48467 RepID=A0A1T4YBV4_9BACT|nr:MMPL family transporter [Prosthecobacter debontii]SKA99264.1 Predicted exporter protein, RND superfamily [Prosthecobacter debontii]